ncbi:hypothetical protein UG56_020075 [Nocardioides luteus]|uniref:Ig-like domain-containing protein n=1 Tax=Nocardioides luteus TaxID=1844 RepID=A0A1J4N076_9ACTN|nr:hypothetical protein UG56_020075 [Nocardioides luteus]
MLRRLPLLIALVVAVLLPVGTTASPANAACSSPQLSKITVARSTVTAGRSTTATVTLSCVPRTRKLVAVKATSGIVVPSSVYVRSGHRTRTFTVGTRLTAITTRGSVSATYNGRTVATALTRRYAYCASPPLSSLTVSPTTIVSGSATKAVARLACRSTKSIRLVVSTTEGTIAHSSGDIWILRDRPSATFLVTARARTNRLNATVKVRKAGSTRWLSDSFVATANPELCMPSSRATSSVIYAGTKPTTVTLKQPCALDISRYVYLGSSNSHVKVPSRVLVPAGKASLGVPVTVADGTSVDTPGNLIESLLSVGPDLGGWAHNFELSVHPGLESTALSTWMDDNGTRNVGARVKLGLAAVADTVVRLESSDPLLPLPSSLTVAKGDSFAQTTQTITAPPEDTEVRVTATFGSQQRTDTVLIQRNFRPGDPIALSKQTFYGGGRAASFIDIGRPAGPDGVTVTASSDSSLLTFEPAVFQPGQTAGGLVFDIAEVTETTPVTLHLTTSEHTYDVPIVLQPGLAAITLPDRATSDVPFTGTVTLTGVSAVDTPVPLISEASSFKVPSEVIIPAGETSATFQGVVHLSSTSSGVVTQLDAYLGRLYTSNDMVVSHAP